MTAREGLEYVLTELNKSEVPSLLLEDYNYFYNKAVYQYSNKIYNQYDGNQQKTDDLRVLKATALLTPTGPTTSISWGDKIFTVTLPNNYYHILGCIVNYKVKNNFKCYSVNDQVQFGATRLTSDMYRQILNNYYMRPMYKRPYYFINNNPNAVVDNIQGSPNPSDVTMELRYGKVHNIFEIESVLIDYLKTPEQIRLTQEQIDSDDDTSQVLEFPDYVCYEIINELVKLIMENASDPRLQSNIPINQTIAGLPQSEPSR